MNYKRNQPIYFQKEPASFHSAPNATFVRDMGEVNGEPVCEIERDGALWIVRYSEIRSEQEYLDELREEWTQAIEAAKKAILPKTTKVAIAAKLGISTATLRKRMRFVEESPTPPEKEA